MKEFGIRAHADLREDKRPAWKFNAWEMRGIPLRIELGPKVFSNNIVLNNFVID